ncbi:unnamed protein product [Symbiodinium natans]|uniref:Uncharacterized protein n=1 Tax=Symbiodinium natans TaxID=878477 RepID=A0A812M5W4_9DINO|nr:unnamed protein product [Symbiodinium natans]
MPKQILFWYAYGLAGEVSDVTDGTSNLPSRVCVRPMTHMTLSSSFCRGKSRVLPLCPTMVGSLAAPNSARIISVTSQHVLKRMVFWEDKKPCVWQGKCTSSSGLAP